MKEKIGVDMNSNNINTVIGGNTFQCAYMTNNTIDRKEKGCRGRVIVNRARIGPKKTFEKDGQNEKMGLGGGRYSQ